MRGLRVGLRIQGSSLQTPENLFTLGKSSLFLHGGDDKILFIQKLYHSRKVQGLRLFIPAGIPGCSCPEYQFRKAGSPGDHRDRQGGLIFLHTETCHAFLPVLQFFIKPFLRSDHDQFFLCPGEGDIKNAEFLAHRIPADLVRDFFPAQCCGAHPGIRIVAFDPDAPVSVKKHQP